MKDRAMPNLYNRFKALSAAEQFLDFFAVPFDPDIVQLNRLHILERFRQYLQSAEGLDGQGDAALFARLRACLALAYEDIAHPDARRDLAPGPLRHGDRRPASLQTMHGRLAPRHRRAAVAARRNSTIPVELS